MNPLVSIVVPTYKRPESLQRCLHALLKQDFDPAAYEIIIADDAASPETQALVEEMVKETISYHLTTNSSVLVLQEHDGVEEIYSVPGMLLTEVHMPALIYIPITGKHGPAAARNTGWRAASAEIIAFTDDDTIPFRDWLRMGVSAMQPEVMGASGRVIVPIPRKPSDYEWDVRGLEDSVFITANCFYRREALEAVGGFDERFQRPWREDSDLFFSMLEKGFTLALATQAVTLHPVRQAPWGVSLRLQSRAMYNALLYKKHPQAYRHFVQSRPPLDYYLILLGLAGIISGLMLQKPALGIVSLVLWVGLTLAFVMRRLRHTRRDLSHVLEMVATSILIPPIAIFWRLVGALKFGVLFL